MNSFIYLEVSKNYGFTDIRTGIKASQYGSGLDWSRDKFYQSGNDISDPKPISFVSRAIILRYVRIFLQGHFALQLPFTELIFHI